MISLRGGSPIAACLVAAAMALGACGGDDDGNAGTTGATAPGPGTTVNTDPGTAGTTTERTGTTREERTTTRERGDDNGGRKRSGSGRGGGSKGGSGNSGSGIQPGNVRKVARTVCNSFLPKVIARDLEKGKRKPEDIARDYSRGFPKRQQQKAYEGCLAGLQARG